MARFGWAHPEVGVAYAGLMPGQAHSDPFGLAGSLSDQAGRGCEIGRNRGGAYMRSDGQVAASPWLSFNSIVEPECVEASAAGMAPPIQPNDRRMSRNWSCGKALSVVVRTLPAEPTVSMKRAAVSSSGASQTST
jgi:hypothetical protein